MRRAPRGARELKLVRSAAFSSAKGRAPRGARELKLWNRGEVEKKG